MAIAISAAADSNWPPRNIVTATGLTVSDLYTVYRSVLGARTVLRGWEDLAATDTSHVGTDAEAPFGVAVTYVLVDPSGTEYTSSPLTVTLPGGKVALTDAISGAAAEVEILAWTGRQSQRQAAVFNVGDRTTIVVSGGLRGATSTIQLLTETSAARSDLLELLNGATSGIVLVRVPSIAYTGMTAYLGTLSLTENIVSEDDGTDDTRTWDMEVVEVSAWASVFMAQGSTYQDVADAYTGSTYADLAGDFATYLDMAKYDWAGA
jgi:hypothetical protein